MKLPMYLRVLLPLTVAACAYALWSESSPQAQQVTPAGLAGSAEVRGARPAVAPQTSPAQGQQGQQDRQDQQEHANLFPDQSGRLELAAASEASDAAEAMNPPPPPPPRAPPMPYQVAGVWVEGGQRKVILNKGQQTIILCQGCGAAANSGVRVGDVLDGNYRLEEIENERITFTYLPLQLKQVVNLDSAMSGTGS